MSTDPMTRLRRADPAADVPPYDPARAVALLDRASSAPGRRPVLRRRRGPVAAAVTAALLAASTGGVAYAVLFQRAETALQISCAVGTTREQYVRTLESPPTVLETTSGDPVADCAAEYERQYGTAPELTAYDSGRSFVTVLPADWPVPPQWEPLAPTFRNDPARVELRSRLGDQLDGPESRCRDADEVEAMVRRDLAELGLRAWTVDRLEQADRADGRRWCALAFVDDEGADTVHVQGVERPGSPGEPDARWTALLQALRRDVADRCLPLEQAQAAAERAVVASGYPPGDARVTAVPDPAADCTRVDVPAAGLVVITLRGPQTAAR